MASVSIYPCTKTPCIHYNLNTLADIACSPISRNNLHIPFGKEPVKPIFVTRNTRKCIISQRRKPKMGPILATDSDSSSEIVSLSDIILKFYTCINKTDRKGLEDLMASDCSVQDMAFPYIIHGKKEVIKYFIELAESMGESVQFKLGTTCEGDDLTASVMWHLEWKDDQIPFSRGCSVFQCLIEGDKLVIRNVQILTESPIKPGALAMALLKVVRSAFDEFPKAADWFLKSPHTILKAVLRIYKLILAPIVNPILTFYTTLWKFGARTLGYAISFLHIIARLFNKDSSSTDNANNNNNNNNNDNNKDTDVSEFESEEGPTSLP